LFFDDLLKDEESVKKAMRGNLCRCTGYRAILDALMDIAASESTVELRAQA
jgi:xanthine dehydrogenase iron-sulfur cluster and FAD-binding subunit A